MENNQPKKRGRKPKKDKIALDNALQSDPSSNCIIQPEVIKKKRGRKPRGGKIIDNINKELNTTIIKSNIILHLRCKIEDLEENGMISALSYDPNINEVIPYNHENNDLSKYTSANVTTNINPNPNTNTNTNTNTNFIVGNEVIKNYGDEVMDENTNESFINDINNKLKVLTKNLQTNNIHDKKSACFWCTTSFDNLPIYIPKFELNGVYNCYGCFCSPECATAFLFKETIDTASKFERYSLLNHIYAKIYNYNKNIIPAPNPLYTLDKFYGNLTIQEYRKQLKSERLLLIVDKPLTRILPEIYEDLNDPLMNNLELKHNKKRTLMNFRNKQTKKDIMSANFNLK